MTQKPKGNVAKGAELRDVRRTKPFTMLSNEAITDPRLSLEAIGLIAYLTHLPPGWQVRHGHLQATLRVGREKLRRIIRELEDGGYVLRAPIRLENGRMNGWQYLFSDVPGDLLPYRAAAKTEARDD